VSQPTNLNPPGLTARQSPASFGKACSRWRGSSRATSAYPAEKPRSTPNEAPTNTIRLPPDGAVKSGTGPASRPRPRQQKRVPKCIKRHKGHRPGGVSAGPAAAAPTQGRGPQPQTAQQPQHWRAATQASDASLQSAAVGAGASPPVQTAQEMFVPTTRRSFFALPAYAYGRPQRNFWQAAQAAWGPASTQLGSRVPIPMRGGPGSVKTLSDAM